MVQLEAPIGNGPQSAVTEVADQEGKRDDEEDLSEFPFADEDVSDGVNVSAAQHRISGEAIGSIASPISARAPDGRTIVVRPSTAIFPNRVRDKIRIEAAMQLPELGDDSTRFYGRVGNMLFAVGYDRIVYGDHGPYIEFGDNQLLWHNFPICRPRPPWGFYDEWHSYDWTLMLYAQKNTVEGKPNPPWGRYAVNNHRPEGYADYRIGKFYIPCEAEDIVVVQRSEDPHNRWGHWGKGNPGKWHGQHQDFAGKFANGKGGKNQGKPLLGRGGNNGFHIGKGGRGKPTHARRGGAG